MLLKYPTKLNWQFILHAKGVTNTRTSHRSLLHNRHVKYNTIYAFEENNQSGIRSREVPVWRGLISTVLSVIISGPNNYYGI